VVSLRLEGSNWSRHTSSWSLICHFEGLTGFQSGFDGLSGLSRLSFRHVVSPRKKFLLRVRYQARRRIVQGISRALPSGLHEWIILGPLRTNVNLVDRPRRIVRGFSRSSWLCWNRVFSMRKNFAFIFSKIHLLPLGCEFTMPYAEASMHKGSGMNNMRLLILMCDSY